MIVILLLNRAELSLDLLKTLQESGFNYLDLDDIVPATGNLKEQAEAAWGADFRVRLATHLFNPLHNEIVTGVHRIEEFLALSRIARVGVIDPKRRLSAGEIDMLEAAQIPVHAVAPDEDLAADTIKPLLMNLASRLPRISWDEYFMRIARIVASRGDCVKRRVAALIVKDRRIVATG